MNVSLMIFKGIGFSLMTLLKSFFNFLTSKAVQVFLSFKLPRQASLPTYEQMSSTLYK